jgi:hypothetical protein
MEVAFVVYATATTVDWGDNRAQRMQSEDM